MRCLLNPGHIFIWSQQVWLAGLTLITSFANICIRDFDINNTDDWSILAQIGDDNKQQSWDLIEVCYNLGTGSVSIVTRVQLSDLVTRVSIHWMTILTRRVWQTNPKDVTEGGPTHGFIFFQKIHSKLYILILNTAEKIAEWNHFDKNWENWKEIAKC